MRRAVTHAIRKGLAYASRCFVRHDASGPSGSRRILLSSIWLAMFVVVGKGIGYLKEATVAYHYGTGAVLDGYLFAFNTLLIPANIFAAVAMTAVPVIAGRLRQQQRHDDIAVLRDGLVSLTSIGGAVVSALSVGAVWWLIEAGAGIEPAARQAAMASLAWLTPITLLSALCTIHSAFMLSEHRHGNTLLDAVPPLCICLAVIAWYALLPSTASPLPLAIATTIGYLCQLAVLWRLSPPWRWRPLRTLAPYWPELRPFCISIIGSHLLIAGTGFLEQWLALHLSSGSLSSLSYAQRLFSLLWMLTGTIIGRSMLPVLSEIHCPLESRRVAARWSKAWALASIGMVIVIALTSDTIVSLAFQRGQFTAEDSQQVSALLFLLSLSLPCIALCQVYNQWLLAYRLEHWLMIATAWGSLIKIATLWILWRSGVAGIVASILAFYMGTVAIQAWAVYRYRPGQHTSFSLANFH